MIYILDVLNDCSSPALALSLKAFKSILGFIQIIVPIILIISIIIHLVNLMNNPDDKKLIPKIRNSAIAAVVIFMIPLFLNLVMGLLDNSYTLSACWNNITEYTGPSKYISLHDNKKTIYTKSTD